MSKMQDTKAMPDQAGHFGPYGGRFVPETLMSAVEELEQAYLEIRDDREFQSELSELSRHYAGRPTALYFAENLTRVQERASGFPERPRIYFEEWSDPMISGIRYVNSF